MEGDSTTIEFRNVPFAYLGSSEGSLKNIDLTIPDGQCVLLCGAAAAANVDSENKKELTHEKTSL